MLDIGQGRFSLSRLETQLATSALDANESYTVLLAYLNSRNTSVETLEGIQRFCQQLDPPHVEKVTTRVRQIMNKKRVCKERRKAGKSSASKSAADWHLPHEVQKCVNHYSMYRVQLPYKAQMLHPEQLTQKDRESLNFAQTHSESQH